MTEATRDFRVNRTDLAQTRWVSGPDAISKVYAAMLSGRINPAVGNILSL